MKIRHLALVAGVALLSACTLLPESRPVNVYRLPPSALAANPSAPLARSLTVQRLHSSQALDSNRIAVVPSDNLFSSYQDARWSSPAPMLLRDHLLDALQRDGRFAALVSDESPLHTDLLLDGDLRAFQVEYLDGKPIARLIVDLRLAETAGQRILANRRFALEAPLRGEDPAAAVRALGAVAEELAQQVARWLADATPAG